ncbi:MAG: 4'-phosphopantetheinyl transferase superfamily protein [Tistlia sp.]|uniref:4'-phosphopantetheinyl transferase superfamily protein n=1 Tax=Tistlia sp. TaxID=3057121 RepID=UPI0034A4AE84
MILEADRVAAFWLATERIGAADWPRLASLLDEAERRRAARFHFERDRQVYIAAHALLRATLSGLTGRAPQDWRFAVDDYGKPEAILLPGEPPLRANLSHTRGLAAVAVTLERDLGVDVEWLERGGSTLEIADRFFAPAECRQLAAVPRERVEATFLAFWTLKEAYIKAVGQGLSLPLDAFAFTLDPAGQPLAIGFLPPIVDEPLHWLFRRFRPGPAHALAVAVRDPDPARLTVTAAPADLAALLALAD